MHKRNMSPAMHRQALASAAPPTGTILRVVNDTAEVWKSEGEDGIVVPVGMAIDQDRDLLFVCNLMDVDLDNLTSSVLIFNLTDGNLLSELSLDDGLPHAFNDVAVDRQTGTAYVTDAVQPVILTIS